MHFLQIFVLGSFVVGSAFAASDTVQCTVKDDTAHLGKTMAITLAFDRQGLPPTAPISPAVQAIDVTDTDGTIEHLYGAKPYVRGVPVNVLTCGEDETNSADVDGTVTLNASCRPSQIPAATLVTFEASFLPAFGGNLGYTIYSRSSSPIVRGIVFGDCR